MSLLQEIFSLSPLDYLATLTALLYVWLAAGDNNLCWFFAAVSSACWAWLSFFEYQLVSDALLQLFYLVMAGVGLWRWRSESVPPTEGERLQAEAWPDPTDGYGDILVPTTPIRRMTVREHALTIGISTLGGLALGYFFSSVMTSAATYPDALTTAFSVTATFLLVNRRLENWLYWIVIDAVYVWIYWGQGALLFAILMVVYTIMAVYGYWNWRREARAAFPVRSDG